jgi:hypothetical protein
VILNERFSKEPYSLVVRRRRRQTGSRSCAGTPWHWSRRRKAASPQSNAEEQRRTATDPNTRRLLGALPEVGGLRLDPAWAFNAIRAVGNYGEVYDRHFGPNTPLATPRARTTCGRAAACSTHRPSVGPFGQANASTGASRSREAPAAGDARHCRRSAARRLGARGKGVIEAKPVNAFTSQQLEVEKTSQQYTSTSKLRRLD